MLNFNILVSFILFILFLSTTSLKVSAFVDLFSPPQNLQTINQISNQSQNFEEIKTDSLKNTQTVNPTAIDDNPIVCPPFNCVGTDMDDVMIGTTVTDTILGLEGNDQIQGNGLNDIIHGNEGDDIIAGGEGTDTLFGDDGNDIVLGESGTNAVYGGGGNFLYGGKGDDKLYGGGDNDVLTGGSGHDFFDCGEGADTVTDFDSHDDTIIGNCEILLNH